MKNLPWAETATAEAGLTAPIEVFRQPQLFYDRKDFTNAPLLQIILPTYPGCVKGLRQIDGDSLDRYLEGLAHKEFTPSPCKRGKGRGRPKKQRIPDEVLARA